jgi:exodeoxyribonuclease VII large subunit
MKIVSVREITQYIKQIFEYNKELSGIYIRGEVSNFKRHYSGHCYFTLKDAEATLRAVMFKSRAQFLKFQPQDGLKVIAGGKISVFERDGQYQLYVEQLLPDGIGELSLAFEQLKNKLQNEGLFAENRKKKLPFLPQKVGIVTSKTGAALRDIITVAKRRYPGIGLILSPVQVQGDQAAYQIEQAIDLFNRQNAVDVLIVGRGGGSIEELWAFNEERVVRAIAASAIPVVSAVGHETDYTLADFAADRRAATPSQAAEIVVPDVAELTRYLSTLEKILESHMHKNFTAKKTRLTQINESRVFSRPQDFLAVKQQVLDAAISRLQQNFEQLIQGKKHQMAMVCSKLSVLNPMAVLERGYSIARDAKGNTITDYREAAIGCKLEIVLKNGILDVEVLKIRSEQHGETQNTNGI